MTSCKLQVAQALLIASTLVIASCAKPLDCSSEEVFCAALVTDTQGLADHGVNQETWLALQTSAADAAEKIESVDARDYTKNIAHFADNGYDIIFTTGAALDKETLHAADLHPDSVFVGINQTYKKPPANLVSLTFPEDQMGFFAGFLAARVTQSGAVGAVCETSDIDSMWRYCEGFFKGAQYEKRNVKIWVEYRNDASNDRLFFDSAWGYERADYLIRKGADVIFAVGGGTGQGALMAATDMKTYAIGAERDQAAALEEPGSSVITSVYGRPAPEVQELIRLLKEGGDIESVISGQIGYAPLNRDFSDLLKSQLDELLLNLWLGKIKTNVAPQKP